MQLKKHLVGNFDYAFMGVAFISACIFLSFPTQQYSGDGLRYYAAISGLAPLGLSGTNHLLYAPLARAYFIFASSLGITPGWTLAQSMNALFGGAALGCFAFIIWSLTRKWGITLAATAILGFSRAFSLHATDMTEPMPGVFFSLLGMAFVAGALDDSRKAVWASAFAGICIGVATALYQSNMFTALGAVMFILLASRWTAQMRLVGAGICAGMMALITAGLYISAFMTIGKIATVSEAIRSSLINENELTQGIYQEIGLRRAGVLVFGLADALFGLRFIDGQGFNFFKDGFTPKVLWTLALVAWSVIALGVVLLIGLCSGSLPQRGKRIVLACFIWLIPQVGLLLFFGARYSKLWIMPLVTLLITIVLIVSSAHRQRILRVVFLGMWLAPVVLGGLLFNIITDHITPNQPMQAAQEINTRLTEKDIVISQWGGLPYVPVPRPQTTGLVPLALGAELDPVRLSNNLNQLILSAQNSGGAVYFYELLDYSEGDWQPFFGDRLRTPYNLLDPYRAASQKLMPVGTTAPDGTKLYLWRLQTP